MYESDKIFTETMINYYKIKKNRKGTKAQN